MTTRRRFSSPRASASAVLFALACAAAPAAVSAQTAAQEESAIRQRFGVPAWTPGASRAGIAVDRIAVPGLSLRARTDRPATEGGISLGFGASATTLLVRFAVGASVPEGQDDLVGFLRGVQGALVPLSDAQGAGVALADTALGGEAIWALYGNVALSIQRTREAGPETPPASRVLAILRSALGPAGAPAMPSLGARAIGSHVVLSGAAFTHVEATVQGGHLSGRPSSSGLDVAAERAGSVDVRIVATDALGRTAVLAMAVTVPAAGR